MKTLDFIVIGAAKAGTTTLFELAKDHPQISMPGEKEVPFFDEEEIYRKGIAWYIKTYFSRMPETKMWGTMTPQYMLGKKNVSPKIIADRIYEASPDTKLVALLRHPVERAYSHYRMLAQRGHFTKSFEEAVDELLANKNLDKLRHENIADSNTFLLGSEYGRILEYFYGAFPPNNILILYTDELKKDPENLLRKFFRFLGINDGFKSDNLGKEFRKGGSKARVTILTPGYIYKIPFVKRVWKDYIPYSFRKRIEYSINLWNTKAGRNNFDPNSEAYKKLVVFYSDDIRKLEKLTGQKVPWEEWH